MAIGNCESILDDFNSQTESARSLGRFYWTLICSCLNHVTRGRMIPYINSQYNPNRGLCFSSDEFLFLVFYLKDASCMFLALCRVWPSAHLLSLCLPGGCTCTTSSLLGTPTLSTRKPETFCCHCCSISIEPKSREILNSCCFKDLPSSSLPSLCPLMAPLFFRHLF